MNEKKSKNKPAVQEKSQPVVQEKVTDLPCPQYNVLRSFKITNPGKVEVGDFIKIGSEPEVFEVVYKVVHSDYKDELRGSFEFCIKSLEVKPGSGLGLTIIRYDSEDYFDLDEDDYDDTLRVEVPLRVRFGDLWIGALFTLDDWLREVRFKENEGSAFTQGLTKCYKMDPETMVLLVSVTYPEVRS